MCLTGCILDLSSSFSFKKVVLEKTSSCTAGIAKKDGHFDPFPGGSYMWVFMVEFYCQSQS